MRLIGCKLFFSLSHGNSGFVKIHPFSAHFDSLDIIVVDVVEDAHAGLDALVDVELGVVRLGHVAPLKVRLVPGEGPRLVGPAGRGGVGGGHLHAGTRPEPAVHLYKAEEEDK